MHIWFAPPNLKYLPPPLIALWTCKHVALFPGSCSVRNKRWERAWEQASSIGVSCSLILPAILTSPTPAPFFPAPPPSCNLQWEDHGTVQKLYVRSPSIYILCGNSQHIMFTQHNVHSTHNVHSSTSIYVYVFSHFTFVSMVTGWYYFPYTDRKL